MAQAKPKTVEVSNPDLKKILASIESVSTYKLSQAVAQVYVVGNGSGSAKLPESDETSHSLLVSVSEYGEHPASRLFKVGPLMNPKIVADKGSAQGEYVMVTEGLASARKTHKLSFANGRVSYQ
ncbi:hypothetical protein [Hymenobacter negativus]|uniref:Uncharacterized protein n=1 Tax=Hymenobacter negativus TaxID=2795026 RepID=A0ABS0Q2M7_9BACT|nr:hypothetical protein [Hymenobacter negativus]MBH8556911.1 hypothetical protein [Hymenobacter negativus]